MTTEEKKEYRQYLKDCSHEELEILVLNAESSKEDLRQRLFLLTGCVDFGCFDPMDGSCVDCGYDNKKQCDRCCAFEDMIMSYKKMKKE